MGKKTRKRLPAANINTASATDAQHDTPHPEQVGGGPGNCAEFLAERLGVEVLGNTAGSMVWLYSHSNRRVTPCPLGKLNTILLSQLSGRAVGVELGKANLTLSELKDHIAQVGSGKSLDSHTPRGAGIYREGDSLLIVNGSEAFLWNGRKKSPLAGPIHNGSLLDLNEGYQLIPNLDEVLSELPDLTPGHLKKIWTGLVARVQHWRWVQPFSAEILAGQIIATILQATWSWKAHTYLCAKRNTGKTTFLNTLATLLGPLAQQFGPGTTEPAIRQNLGTRGHFVLIDEFERFKEREHILALLRAGNQGGTVVKGTPSGHALSFRIDALAWVASIEHAADTAADRSRFLTFELQQVTAEQKALGLPTTAKLAAWGRVLYLAAFRRFRKFWQAADQLKVLPDTGLDGRIQDALAVPCAIWATLTETDPAAVLQKVAKAWKPTLDQQIVEDEVALLRDILQYKFRTEEHAVFVDHRLRPTTVGQAVIEGHADSDLVALGIKCTHTRFHHLVVAFWPDAVRRHCLKGTRWATLNIRDILLRLPGATATRLRMAGISNARVVVVPLSVIQNLDV